MSKEDKKEENEVKNENEKDQKLEAKNKVQEILEKVIKCCNGKLLKQPMRWSEDFGNYLNNKYSKGAFIGIGAGDCPDLHTRDYEYPDELLDYHIKTFINLI